jgi:hypothetical protein
MTTRKDTAMTTTTLPTIETTEGPLPAFVFPAGHELPVAENVQVGDIVATYTRGRYRAVQVTKVGPKRATVVYTTEGAHAEALRIADIDYTAQSLSAADSARRNADRYARWAELLESGVLEASDGFVPIASLPAEAQALARTDGMNAAQTTIVYPTEQWREWEADSRERAEAYGEGGAHYLEAVTKDAVPVAERIVNATHVTTKSVPLGALHAV